jgi:hypothetical protein
MGDFAFLIFIMAQPHGQMLSMSKHFGIRLRLAVLCDCALFYLRRRRESFCGISLPKNGFGLKFFSDGRNIGRNVKFLTISLLHVSPRGAAACGCGN